MKTTVAAVILAVIALAAVVRAEIRDGTLMGDYRSFYCAARAVVQHSDPYGDAPIRSCEVAQDPMLFRTGNTSFVLPAPVPGYVALALEPLQTLPFEASAILFAFVLIASVVGAIVIFARLGLAPWTTLLVAFAVPVLCVSVPTGELPPIALLGLALLSLGLAQKRPWVASVGFMFTMCEPQIGVACGAMACVISRRWILPFALTTIVLAALSVAAIGFAANVEYVGTVLPQHIYAELPKASQFSLSWVFHGLNVSDNLALSAGRVWYVLMLATACCLAVTAWAKEHARYAILAAPALVVFGGPFVHLDQIGLAVPGALAVATLTRARHKTLSIVAAIALCAPMLYGFSVPAFVPLLLCVTAWIGSEYLGARIAGFRAAALYGAYFACAGMIALSVGRHDKPVVASTIIAPAAQMSWAAYVRAVGTIDVWTLWLFKLPTWFGLATTVVGFVALCYAGELARRGGARPLNESA